MIIGGEDGPIKALIVFAGGITVGEKFMKHGIENHNYRPKYFRLQNPFKYYDPLEPRQNPLPNPKLAHSLIFSNQSRRDRTALCPVAYCHGARIESENASHLGH